MKRPSDAVLSTAVACVFVVGWIASYLIYRT